MINLWNKVLRNTKVKDGMTVLSSGTEGFKLSTYTTSVTVANGATTGKEAAIGMPANFLPMAVSVTVTTASTNAVNLNDIGDDADTDSYVDGASIALNTTGYKGIVGCNGVRGMGPGSTTSTGATTTADEVEIVISGDPGATGATVRLVFIGIEADS
jgi:hypothetical protein